GGSISVAVQVSLPTSSWEKVWCAPRCASNLVRPCGALAISELLKAQTRRAKPSTTADTYLMTFLLQPRRLDRRSMGGEQVPRADQVRRSRGDRMPGRWYRAPDPACAASPRGPGR